MKWRRSRGEDGRGETPGAEGAAGSDSSGPAATVPPQPRIAPIGEVTSPVWRKFQDRLTAADNAADPAERTRLIVKAIHEFLALGEDHEFRAGRTVLQDRTAQVATVDPDAAVRLVARLNSWIGIDEPTTRSVYTAWLQHPNAESFAETWSATSDLLESDAELATWLCNTVRAGTEPSPEFARLARTHLVDLVDSDFTRYEFSGATSPVWMLLYALGPATRPDWFLHFGDRAAARGDETEAARRYEFADRFGGGTKARTRLRHLHDIGAYHRLRRGITASDQLKGPGTPTPYRNLVLATAAVMEGRPAAAALTEVTREGDKPIQHFAKFLAALDHLRNGDRATARRQLRELLDATAGTQPPASGPGSIPSDSAAAGIDSMVGHTGTGADANLSAAGTDGAGDPSDIGLRANIRLVLGALEDDDALVAEGASMLLTEFREHWPSRAMVDAATVLTAVSRVDATLLPELIGAADSELHGAGGELDALRLNTARTFLSRAARATLFARFDRTRTLLDQATQLLTGADGEAADELRQHAILISETMVRLQTTAALERPLDRLAFAALTEDGAARPWTQTALRLWQDNDTESEPNPDSLHHLAIAEHARAYQLEIEGDAAAFEHWRNALAAWARLHADETFWDRLRTHLTAVSAATTPDEVTRAVDEARGELPAQVLEPHVTRVQDLRKDELPRARAHLDLIRTAPFEPADIKRARARLAREAGGQIRRMTREARFDRALDEVQAWLEIDADNIPLAELALDVGIETVEDENRRGEGWGDRARPVLERVDTMVEPLRAELGLTVRQMTIGTRPVTEDSDRAAFSGKLARHEFWLGVCSLVTTIDRVRANPYADRTGFRSAVTHLNIALRLGLPGISPYDNARDLLVAAGKWERAAQGGSVVGFF
ncbi:hypothetical protein [Nocardia sp. NPDC020380]|uniref:hypothetical protein n=1 Tax=Nocardia sp. NPDC020380 TaxID=3364309 RepID=UPI0037A54409